MFLIVSHRGMGQNEQRIDNRNPAAMMRASFLFQFAKQSNWNNSESSQPFVIAVYNNTDVYKYLSKKYASQPVGSQTLKVIEIKTTDQLATANIIFVDKSKMADFKKIKQHYANASTMIVTEKQGSLKEGSIINFLIIDSKLKIEINNEEAKKKKISIGKQLLNWSVNN